MVFYRADAEVAPQEVGMDGETLKKLEELFRSEVEAGRLFWGGQLAVFRRGKRVLDMGGGLRRASDKAPVTPETMFVLYSSTKGLAALAMHMLHDRGKFAYHDPICRYWPEFAGNGKERATIAHLLGHRVGIPTGPEWLQYSLWGDRSQCARAMEELTPRWSPGEANGYHPLNYGFVLNELMLRLDGRDCGQFLQEEICAPLGLTSLFVGLPQSEEQRVACVYESPSDQDSLEQMASLMGFTPDEEYFAFQRSINFEEEVNETELPFPEWANIFNRPAIHRIVLPAGGGIASARDLAKVYAMIALGGTWEGKHYLEPTTLERAITPTNKVGDIDRMLRIPVVYGLGWMLGHLARGATLRTFGHPGKGGQMGIADLDRELSFAFVNTGQKDYTGFFQFSNELLSLALDACR
jgi:CubicO group peptidase (beta-lactamase class C family)